MTQFGYPAMGEQTPARQPVTGLVAAELAGVEALVQAGAKRQHDFISWAGNELRPAPRELG